MKMIKAIQLIIKDKQGKTVHKPKFGAVFLCCFFVRFPSTCPHFIHISKSDTGTVTNKCPHFIHITKVTGTKRGAQKDTKRYRHNKINRFVHRNRL